MNNNSLKNNSSNNQSKRVFENAILHCLSKNHIAVPLTVFFGGGIALPLLCFVYFDLIFFKSISCFLLGLLIFSLFEYLIHRFVYHLPTVYKEGHVAYVLHGIHHKFPRDKKRLVMPPILSVLIAAIILAINYWLFKLSGMAFSGGFFAGYASYLSVHYAIHAFKPPKNFLRTLWVNHNIHHHFDDTKAFGVSSPLWDYVFGTIPESNKKP